MSSFYASRVFWQPDSSQVILSPPISIVLRRGRAAGAGRDSDSSGLCPFVFSQACSLSVNTPTLQKLIRSEADGFQSEGVVFSHSAVTGELKNAIEFACMYDTKRVCAITQIYIHRHATRTCTHRSGCTHTRRRQRKAFSRDCRSAVSAESSSKSSQM